MTAMVGILATGLRNDIGGEVGRTAIMCDPYGPNDLRGNMHLQRERGNVRVVICIRLRWELFGATRCNHPDIGVCAYITGAGAILFANTNLYIATVIPMSCVTVVWMHYPFDDHFVGQTHLNTALLRVTEPDGSAYGMER
jgi:hypothetical protein